MNHHNPMKPLSFAEPRADVLKAVFAPATPPTDAAAICKRAADIVSGDRARQHGDKERNFSNIAVLWNAYRTVMGERRFEPKDVGVFMALMKMARMESGEFNDDDYTDGVGYLALSGELAAGK